MSIRPCGELVCSLCGRTIGTNPELPVDACSREHVPPKQFYPKKILKSQQVKLWVVPAHEQCNKRYREDEEYFYHSTYPFVQKGNPQMGQVIHRDMMRRAHKPQTPAMARRLVKSFKTITDGGIYMPPGIAMYDLDAYRIQRVVIKIAQGLFYLDERRYLPLENCKDLRLCMSESEVPEFYKLSWQGAETKFVLPMVFSYRRFIFENLHLFSMLFWGAFMFCAAFENPCSVTVPTELQDGSDDTGVSVVDAALDPLPNRSGSG